MGSDNNEDINQNKIYNSKDKLINEELSENMMTLCDNTIQTIIRKCWMDNPGERANFFEICSLLSNQIQYLNQNQINFKLI